MMIRSIETVPTKGQRTPPTSAEPESVLRGRGVEARAELLVRQVSALRLQDLAPVMAIAAVAREVQAAIAGMPVVLVKGLDFAEVLFGGVANRAFGDIDLLYDQSAEADLRGRLKNLSAINSDLLTPALQEIETGKRPAAAVLKEVTPKITSKMQGWQHTQEL